VSRLFAAVYLDEDVSVLVGELLRSRGVEAWTARDAGNLGLSDAAQLEYAASREMTVLTHNRGDFETLHQRYLAQGLTHWGIIVAGRRSPYDVMERVLRLLNWLSADELRGHLLYI
jgi:hypothetical protein